MIPQFPVFRAVDTSDRELVEAHTRRFLPYSDFNFTSLWAWDMKGERMISELNNNLVVRFTDYRTGAPFLSFLGESETEHTARAIIRYCKEESLPTTLRLVPEVSVKDIRSSVLLVEEDRDNFDYLYSISEHAALVGGDYKRSRNFVNSFTREYPSAHIEIIDLAETDFHKNLLSVIDAWEKGKIQKKREYEVEHEKAAIRRLFATAGVHTLIVSAVFVEEALCAFGIDEILPNQYCISHFQKADSAYKGINDFLNQKKALHFETLGCTYINLEQDLGIEGLRQSKMAFRPVNFLKKYTISEA